MDQVYIHGLELKARIGVHGWEQQTQQTLKVDLSCGLDLSVAGESDDLADTIDYAAIAQMLQNLAVEKHYALLEHLAETMAAQVLAAYPIQAVDLHLIKLGAVGKAQVGVSIQRQA